MLFRTALERYNEKVSNPVSFKKYIGWWFVAGCFYLTWWRHQMETFSALLAICAGNSPVSGEFPAQRPVTRSFDVFFDVRLIKRLSKHSRGWWFETLSYPLWRHRNEHNLRVLVRNVDAVEFPCKCRGDMIEDGDTTDDILTFTFQQQADGFVMGVCNKTRR